MWTAPDANHGQWYGGEIVSIDHTKQTVHIKFADGDEDTTLAWKHVCIGEDDPSSDG